MPLSWNEIKARALQFSREWKGEGSERAEAQSFWNGFFNVFGIDRRRVAIFEKQVEIARAGRRLKSGRIDLFWKGVLLVEHKSTGENLDRAFAQAADYFDGLLERDVPRYILVCDFERFRLHDLEADTTIDFRLSELHRRVRHFGFIAGYTVEAIEPQDPVNIRAAEKMGRLHDLIKASGYTGHPLEVLLVRILFCLFADNTGIFQPAQSFRMWLDERTGSDGVDLGPQLAQLFQVLNRPTHARPTTLDEGLRAFPYVNGRLFEEALPIAAFDARMRETLLDCCALDWSAISPAIFGALFQSIMDEKARRNLGAHYTSEQNILKVIKPLFLDDLWVEFEKAKTNRNRLFEFHKKLRTLTFLDPACGCGNFLVISYRELRKLELEILRASRALEGHAGQQHFDVQHLITLDVDQFYGIEIEEFPAQIAQVALWMVDHQMNMRVSEEFGNYFARIPLVSSSHIVHGNALRIDWSDVLPSERCSYVMGNPPFVGARLMSQEQRTDMEHACAGVESAGLLDLVAAWYVLAARYIRGTAIPCAFVSTNSITQGEQVGVLWGWLLARGMHIHFAHRTFRWRNEARGASVVHCVIVGFAAFDVARKVIYDYVAVDGEPHAVVAQNINPYLVDAADIILPRRPNPICAVPQIGIGNKPIDGGNYLFTTDERDAFVRREPDAGRHFRRWLGADEFINGHERWCLWLGDCSPTDLRHMPEAMKRVEAVKRYRLASRSAPTRALASTPTRFHVENMPRGSYLIIPRHSGEVRRFVPIGFAPPNVMVGDACLVSEVATRFHFGILTSTMHNAWIRYTCGRLESRYRYSAEIVYDNFPWPDSPTETQRQRIEASAQGVLDARAAHAGASLADLYDPLAMPPDLVRAHQALDTAVDIAYGRK
ncbi:MAG TPA: DNA methyltransferase, partial [Casimicrobiaceae bacterium]|nr:DNA methyltransferase [Casimicrobiaceae bacterium]